LKPFHISFEKLNLILSGHDWKLLSAQAFEVHSVKDMGIQAKKKLSKHQKAPGETRSIK